MATDGALDNISASVPSLSETELQLDQQQGGESMGRAGVNADANDAPLPGQQEGIVMDVSESRKGERSDYDSYSDYESDYAATQRDDHLRAIAEIEEVGSKYTADEIIIPSDLRETLPSAVESLLSRLESSTSDDPVREFTNDDLRVPGFGDLFGGTKDKQFEEKFGQMPEGWGTAVRLLIMRAAGNCRTLEMIRLCYRDLTFLELKALVDPLQTSLVLRELLLNNNAIVDRKEGCNIIVEFLKRNRSLRVLTFTGLVGCPPPILHYLAIHGHSTVENLNVGRKLKKKQIARIMQACPNLRRMRNNWKIDNEESAMLYAQALIEHPSFCHVHVEGPAGPVSSFLLSSCTGARSVTSLTTLRVKVTGDGERLPRNVLQPMVLANRNLENIKFGNLLAFSEEWQGMFRSLKQNSVLRSLTLKFIRFEEVEGFNLPAWEELVAWVKQGSTLESLSLRRDDRGCQHDLCSLIEAITSNKRGIQSLDLRDFKLSSNANEALISMINENGPLEKLTLYEVESPSWKDVFNALRYNSVLSTLNLPDSAFTDPGLETLLAALQVNRTLKEIDASREVEDLFMYALQEKEREGVVTYAYVSTCTTNKERVVRSLRQNVFLQHLYLSFMPSEKPDVEEFDRRTWDELEALFQQSCTLESLTIYGNEFKHDLLNLFKSITFSKTIRCLRILQVGIDGEESEALARAIQDSTSLQQLNLYEVGRARWETIFRSLRYNTGLQTLNLFRIHTLDGGAFKELLAALQVNSSLEEIDMNNTNWSEEGKGPIIREALKQKGRRETYLAAMRLTLGQEEFRVPSTGRLFLCGSPCAGKTQLRIALTQAATGRNDKRRPFSGCFSTRYDLRRTEGIEIQQLNIDSLEISIWDLAGQNIFRALQDILFPKLNLACVFLLVFSPFDNKSNSLKEALSEELYREVLPWLRFIASNSSISSVILPQVKIVISHRDKLDHPLSLLWAEDVINNFRLQFAEILDIDKTIFCINSMDLGEDVHDILNHTVNSFHDLLRYKLFKVPSTCLTLGSVLAKLGQNSHPTTTRNLYKPNFTFPSLCINLGTALAIGRKVSKSRVTREPILFTSEFFDLCQREIVSLEKFHSNEPEGRKLLNAVAEYLHDAGNIIQLVESDVVVVDPNWFTFSFLGRLIGAGHAFQTPLVCVDRYKTKKDGHLSTAAFKELLGKFSQILTAEGYSGMDEEILETLMKEMYLCFHVSQADGYFAPTIFAGDDLKRSSEGLRQLPGWRCVAQRPNIIFVGVRVQCRDRLKTSLTPSFFPRFQVHFRNLLISSRDLGQIDCDYNMIYFIFEEYEVYVESDGDAGDHIDIMVRSPATRAKTVKFIYEIVARAIEDFCASCCPGVALVVGVLRTKCVEKLTLSAHRDENQAILVEDLKERWKEYILGRDVKSTTWEEEEEFANYSYLWPRNDKKDADLIETLERAKDLLTKEDYLEVLNLVKGASLSMEKQWDGFKAVEQEIEKEIGGRASEDGSRNKQSGEGSSASEQSRSSQSGESTFSSHASRPSGSHGTSEHRKIQRAFSGEMTEHEKTRYDIRIAKENLGQKIDEVDEHIQEVKNRIKGIERSVQSFQHYQDKMLATKVSMNGKLDRLIGLTASLAKSIVPSRPYFTSADVKWTHRISATVQIGRAMTLHFMCEERSGNHLVKEQPGYPITVSKENKEFLRFLSVNSVKVLWYLLKAGVHVAAGLGNVVPDLETGERIALLTASTIGSVLSHESMVSESKVVKSDQTNVDKDSWQFLKQLFSETLRSRCVELFLLYRARYVGAPVESGQVWLCKECAQKGKRSKSVVLVDD